MKSFILSVILLAALADQAIATQRVIVVDTRPSGTGSRTAVLKTWENLAQDSVIHTVAAGKVFYVLSYGLSIQNPSVLSIGRLILRDVNSPTKTDKIPVIIPNAVSGALIPELIFGGSFPEPLQFASTVSASVVAGSVLTSGFVTGYEE